MPLTQQSHVRELIRFRFHDIRYGDYTHAELQILASLGYHAAILWTIDTLVSVSLTA